MNATFLSPLPQYKSVGSYGESDNPQFYHPYTKYVVDNFATCEALPKGYRGDYIGEKGKRHDWIEFILTFPLLQAILILMILVPFLGLVYCCCRLHGRCSPYSRRHENHCRRFLCCIMVIVALLLVAAICWALYISINAQLLLHKLQRSANAEPGNARQRQIKHVLETNYDELIDYSQATADDLARDNRAKLRDQMAAIMKNASKCKSKSNDAMKYVTAVTADIDQLRIDIMEWNDFMRLLHTNMTFHFLQTERGEEIMENLQFKTFYIAFLHMGLLVRLERTVKDVKYVVGEIQNRFKSVESMPDYLNKKVNSILDQSLDSAHRSLHDRGNKFRSLSQRVQNEQNEQNSPSNHHSKSSNTASLPRWALYLPWIGYILVILICICVLIGILYALLDVKEQRRRSRCFQLVVFMIFIFFALIGISVLWCFFYGIAIHNNVRNEMMEEQQLMEQQSMEQPSSTLCRPGKSVLETMQSEGFVDPNSTILQTNVDLLTQELKDQMPNATDTTGPIMEISKATTDFNSPRFCNDIMDRLDLEYFKKVYNEMSAYANAGMGNQWGQKDASICHLNWFKRTRIDPFDKSALAKRLKRLHDACKHLVEIFAGSIEDFADQCLRELQKVDDFFQDYTEKVVPTATDGLDKLYDDHMSAYINRMSNVLEEEIGLCTPRLSKSSDDDVFTKMYANILNSVWSGVFLILLLLLPLLIAALILAIIYQRGQALKERKELRNGETAARIDMAGAGTTGTCNMIRSPPPTSQRDEAQCMEGLFRNSLMCKDRLDDVLTNITPAPACHHTLDRTVEARREVASQSNIHKLLISVKLRVCKNEK